LLSILSLQEHRFDLLIEEFPGSRIPGIQPVVVDEKGLMLEPFGPTMLADLFVDSLPDVISKGRLLELGSFLLTTSTAYRIHWSLGIRVKKRPSGKG
jgi:hypothetical protein